MVNMSGWGEAFKSANIASNAKQLMNHVNKIGGALKTKRRKSRQSRRRKSRRL